MIIEINDSKKKYLGEVDDFKEGLPKNCLFDKGRVGSGGTTLALTSKDPYVIAVPYKAMIENKVHQFNGKVFGVDGNTNKNEFLEYIDNTESPKIMTTYDSLGKVTEWIEYPGDYRLLVDEVHLLFTQYSFRYEAVRKVLDNYEKYKDYCFLTATVLEDEFILDELKHLPIVTANWVNVGNVNIDSIKCNHSVSATVVQIVNEFLEGTRKGDMYLFVNSVKFIKEIVKLCKLNDNNCMGVWSKNNEERNIGIKNSNSYDKPRKINFFTSCNFEGLDIYNPNGNIFIVSDGNRQHTLIDISTSFQQIAGRIRDSRYLDNITHIYTNTRYDIDVTYDKFKEICESNIEDATTTVKALEQLTKKQRNLLRPSDEAYINVRDGEFIYDPNLLKIDLYNFKVCKHLYSLRVNLNNEYDKHGFEFINGEDNSIPIARMDKVSNSFRNVVIELEKNPEDKELYYAAYKKYPFLEDAINRFDFKGIKKYRYVIKTILDNLTIEEDININSKIIKLIKNNYKLNDGVFFSNKDIKEVIQQAYNTLNIDKVAKGTDIENYFTVKEYTKEYREGGKIKKIRGYIYIGKKVYV